MTLEAYNTMEINYQGLFDILKNNRVLGDKLCMNLRC